MIYSLRPWLPILTAVTICMGATEPLFAQEKTIDPELAIKKFQVPSGFKVDLWASEPQLNNPVALGLDEKGRVYVVETFRLGRSVYDVRNHMNMYADDLAARTVEDREAMIRKYLGDQAKTLAVDSEVLRVLEDTTGKGKADKSTVFAEGFNSMVDGLAAGVLARKGKVYFSDVPNLWLLQDTNQDDRADTRLALSTGYGVHFNLVGHDLHGLRFGPDGKLYFSMGDRGFHVKTKEGQWLNYPDMGAALRCDADGSNLEVYAYGLRNPQGLAFDDYGNLFTGDNNCDHGDSARLVFVAEGGDSGWRTGNQFSETTPAGVWNSEKLWHLQFPGQAAYIIPPIGHIADGPSGMAHYPGTGFPEAYRDHFFLSDFRGTATGSGVHSFRAEPNGANFKMAGQKHFFWDILATAVDFSPDGHLFVSDWVQGWDTSSSARLYRLFDPTLVDNPLVLETKKLIAEGMEKRPLPELAVLLGHADQRVRQEAQFELASRGGSSAKTLESTLKSSTNQLARIHAIWALGQLGAHRQYALTGLEKNLKDADPEIRAQIAKVLGDGRITGASSALIKLLDDANPRVKYFAALSLGKLKIPAALKPLLAMVRANADKDVALRHAGVMGLVGTAGTDPASTKPSREFKALLTAGQDESTAVRMAVLLALRRLEAPQITQFLHDREPLIVLEAARAINDLPIQTALPDLAKLANQPTRNDPLDWRAINAAYRVGGDANAQALAQCAANLTASDKVRGEALRDLETWANPTPRNRLTGLWSPLPAREAKPAADALRPVVAAVLSTPSPNVQVAAVHAVTKLGLHEAESDLAGLVADNKLQSQLRIEALKALEELHSPALEASVQIASADNNADIRTEATRLRATLKPSNAAAEFAKVLESGGITEQQGAYAALGKLKDAASDEVLAQALEKLLQGKIARELQLDLLLAAGFHKVPAVQDKLKQYQARQPANDDLKGFREALYGGNAEAGRKVFMEKAEAACTRCHKVNGSGGEVGPELTGIITRRDREYILESILLPNKQIAAGFESLLVKTKGGDLFAGIVKKEDANELTLNVNDDGQFKVMTFKKSDLQSRERGQSAMPEGMGQVLPKTDIRNLVEFLSTLKATDKTSNQPL